MHMKSEMTNHSFNLDVLTTYLDLSLHVSIRQYFRCDVYAQSCISGLEIFIKALGLIVLQFCQLTSYFNNVMLHALDT